MTLEHAQLAPWLKELVELRQRVAELEEANKIACEDLVERHNKIAELDAELQRRNCDTCAGSSVGDIAVAYAELEAALTVKESK